MSNLKRWRRIGEGQFHKWETAGDELQGMWRGVHEGRFGLLGTVETADDVFTFPLPVALRDRLQRVRPGAEVRIRYTGLQTSKAGRVFKGFEVFVAGAEPWEEPAAASVALVRREEG
jgi:hypothetical protein